MSGVRESNPLLLVGSQGQQSIYQRRIKVELLGVEPRPTVVVHLTAGSTSRTCMATDFSPEN